MAGLWHRCTLTVVLSSAACVRSVLKGRAPLFKSKVKQVFMMSTSTDSSQLLDFLLLVGKLKHIKRTGWVLRNVPDPECVAGHMHRMAVMTLLLDKTSNLDKVRCMKLALVHDLAECIVGDLTPHCGIDPNEKHRLENNAMKRLQELAGPSGTEFYELYKEYETRGTPEAKFVKELDSLDMIIEAFDYESTKAKPNSLQEFFDSTKGKFSHPLVLSIAEEVTKRREKSSLDQ